ncbi:MAG: hypothetical protein ACRDT4_21785 [Micromonosporaceae bacterium]
MTKRGRRVSVGIALAVAVLATLALSVTSGNALARSNAPAPADATASSYKGYNCEGRICTWGTESDTGRSVRGWARVSGLYTAYQYRVRVYVYYCNYADGSGLDPCYRQTVSAWKYSSYGADAVSVKSDWVADRGDYTKTYAHYYKRKRGGGDWAFAGRVRSERFS